MKYFFCGERSRPGCGSTRPRVEPVRMAAFKFKDDFRAHDANDEGVVGGTRGACAPHF
jgi:hypothetical protein